MKGRKMNHGEEKPGSCNKCQQLSLALLTPPGMPCVVLCCLGKGCLYGKQTPNVPPPPSRQPQLWFSCLAGVCNSKEPNNWVRASIRAGRAGEAGAGGSELPQLRARGWVWIQRLEPLTDTRALSAAGATQGHLVLPIHSQALLFAGLLLPLSRSGETHRLSGTRTEHPQGSAALAYRCAGGSVFSWSPKAPAGFPSTEQMAQQGKASPASSQASLTEIFPLWNWDEFCPIPASVAVRG